MYKKYENATLYTPQILQQKKKKTYTKMSRRNSLSLAECETVSREDFVFVEDLGTGSECATGYISAVFCSHILTDHFLYCRVWRCVLCLLEVGWHRPLYFLRHKGDEEIDAIGRKPKH